MAAAEGPERADRLTESERARMRRPDPDPDPDEVHVHVQVGTGARDQGNTCACPADAEPSFLSRGAAKKSYATRSVDSGADTPIQMKPRVPIATAALGTTRGLFVAMERGRSSLAGPGRVRAQAMQDAAQRLGSRVAMALAGGDRGVQLFFIFFPFFFHSSRIPFTCVIAGESLSFAML